MVSLADQGAAGTINTTGQDTIYIEAIVEGRARDIVIEVEHNSQVISQQALGLRVAVPVEALTSEARLQIRRHRNQPFGAGFNPVVQITSGTNQHQALVMAGLDIAGRSEPVIATLNLADGQLNVTRTLGKNTGTETGMTVPREAAKKVIEQSTHQTGAVDMTIPAPRSVASGNGNGTGVRQVVRHAVNQRKENGQPLPTGQWNIWVDSSASAKAAANTLHVMQMMLEEILTASSISTPSENIADDWIGPPRPQGTQNNVAITDLPFTAATTTKLVVINAAQLETVFGTPDHIFYCTPTDVDALANTETTANDLINSLIDFLTQQNGGN